MNDFSNQIRRSAFIAGLSVILLSALLAFLPACSTAPAQKAHLKVASLPYLGFTAMFIAQDEGYFAEQGLEVEFVNFNSLTQAIPLLGQGSLDIGAGSINASIFNGIAQGINFKIVASREYFVPGSRDGALMARRDLYESGQLNTVSKIKTKQVATSCLACINEFELAKILEKSGLSLNDVKLVRMNNEDMIPALQNKAVDAVIVGDPLNDQLHSMGLATEIESVNSVLPGFQYGFIVYGPKLLGNKTDLGKKFLDSYFKGVERYNQGKTKQNIDIVKKYLRLDDKAIDELTWNPVSKNGEINLNDISVFQDWAASRNLLDKKIAVKDAVDTRFIAGR
jgi:NitT/TauT family transport system substrate-binding protein